MLATTVPNSIEADVISQSQLVDAHLFWPAALNLFTLGFFLAGVATFLSSCDRYRWRTIGIVVAFYVVQMIIELVALAVGDLHLHDGAGLRRRIDHVPGRVGDRMTAARDRGRGGT